MKLLVFLCLLLSTCVPLVKGQTGAETSDVSTTGTTGSLTTTGESSSTTGAVGGTTGTTGVQSYVSYFPSNNATLNLTLSVGGGSLDIELPAIQGAQYVVYGEAAPGQSEYQEPGSSAPTGVTFSGVSFVITVFNNQGNPIHGALSSPMRIKLSVTDVTTADAVYLYNTDTNAWENAAETCSTQYISIDVATKTVTVDICHLTQFAVFRAQETPETPVDSPSSSGMNSGLIATVVVVPVVVVGIVIGLVAFTLLRNKKGVNKNSQSAIEMGNRRPNTTAPVLTAASVKAEESSDESEDTSDEDEETSDDEEDDDNDDDDEEEAHREKPTNAESSSSESESSSDDEDSHSSESSSTSSRSSN